MDGLNLLVLRSADMERARDFYACFDLAFERHRHGSGPAHYAADGGQGVLEIYPVKKGEKADNAGLGFVVADLDATSARLCEAGFQPGEIGTHPWGASFVVRDGDGRRVEVQAKD